MNNGEFDIPIGGKVVAIETSRVKILDDDGNQIYVSKDQVMKLMHVTSEKGVDDMINLGDLQEYAILRNLHKRYKGKNIYVSFGSPRFRRFSRRFGNRASNKVSSNPL